MRSMIPFSLALGLSLSLAACSDTSNTGPAAEDIPFAAAVTGDCELVADVARDTRSYFPQPEQRDASDVARAIRSSCDAADQTAVTAGAWQLMTMIEDLAAAGRGGDPVVGSRLSNELLACTASLCLASAIPGIDFTSSLSSGGLFAVRSNGTTPVFANGGVPFVDEEGSANNAFWSIFVDDFWSTVAAVPTVLVYGHPIFNGGPLNELNIGDVRYELNVTPDGGEFVDGALHVCVAFENAFDLPLVNGQDPAAGLRRNNVVLEIYSGCPQPVAAASLIGPLATLIKRVLPTSLTRLFRATRVGVIGGTPLDFSNFAAVASDTDGTLEFATLPNAVVVAGESIGTIEVRARSGDGTPMEKVLVELSIRDNRGVPAGAILSGDLASYTLERAGEEGIATFPDDGAPVSVGKAGGYRICANGTLNGFTFPEICTPINARNSN